jgi:hypothetical protein
VLLTEHEHAKESPQSLNLTFLQITNISPELDVFIQTVPIEDLTIEFLFMRVDYSHLQL